MYIFISIVVFSNAFRTKFVFSYLRHYNNADDSDDADDTIESQSNDSTLNILE